MDKNILALQILLNDHEDAGLLEDGINGTNTSNAVDIFLIGENPTSITQPPNTIIEEPKTANFVLKEYYSGIFVNGVKIRKAVRPPDELFSNIKKSMDNLEILRRELKNPKIFITSGYRTPEYNSNPKIGGVENSAHLRGSATDINVEGYTPKQVYDEADKLFPEAGIGLYDWGVHIDFDTEINRPQRWDERK